MNTDTATSPSVNTRCATGSVRSGSVRYPSTILLKPDGSRATHQPVGFCTSTVGERWTSQSGLRRVRRLHHRAVDPRIDLDFEECRHLDDAIALVEHSRLQQEAGLRVGPEHVAVAHPVARLHDERLRVAPGDRAMAPTAA